MDLKQLVELISAGRSTPASSRRWPRRCSGDLAGLKFELDNATKDVRYYTHLAEGLAIPTVVGEAVHQSLALASALGHGKKFVPPLVEAQEQLTGAKIVPEKSAPSPSASEKPRGGCARGGWWEATFACVAIIFGVAYSFAGLF